MWPGFDSRTRRHMWVEFIVGSRPCSERFFSRYSGFPLSSKTNISKFQFDLDYCQALYHEPLAREIAQALPVLLRLNKKNWGVKEPSERKFPPSASTGRTSIFCRRLRLNIFNASLNIGILKMYTNGLTIEFARCRAFTT